MTSATIPVTIMPAGADPVLGVTDLERAHGPVDIRLPPGTHARVAHCHEFVRRCLDDGRAVYGTTTGFGPLVAFGGREEPADQCDNALAHLGAGQGPDLGTGLVRAAMLVRLWALCQGRSGVSVAVVDALVAALRSTFAPAVPRLGSVGASGDLIPLSYVAQALRGRGSAYVDGVRCDAAAALRSAGLTALELDGRDALALVNGTSLTTAAAGLAVAGVERSRRASILLSGLLADVLGCAPAFADPVLLAAYGHAGAMRTGADLRTCLGGIRPSAGRGLQEPYSLRCTPQLIGAVGSALSYARDVVTCDLNGVSDNPLFFPERDLVVHGGNFFGQPVAFAADLLVTATVQLGNLAERQLDLLVDPCRNGGLPPMLAVQPGRQHAVQGVQLAATAMIADMRRNAVPASMQSLPTNLHNQDIVPFGTQAALNALDQARTLRLVQGGLAVALRQAVHAGARRPSAPLCAEVFDSLAADVPPIDVDRPLDADVRRAADVLDRLADDFARRHPATGWATPR